MQQSLQTDLRNSSLSHAIAPAIDDAASIARAAHAASVDFVVEGNIQIVDDQTRLTASLFNKDGLSIGSAKATGDVHRLFDLEDALADQLHDGLRKATRAIPTTPIPAVASSGPIRIAPAASLPIGSVPESYTSAALRDGRDRYIYQVPFYGCFGGYGCGGYGSGGCGYGYGSFGGLGSFGIPAGFNGSGSGGGSHSLAW